MRFPPALHEVIRLMKWNTHCDSSEIGIIFPHFSSPAYSEFWAKWEITPLHSSCSADTFLIFKVTWSFPASPLDWCLLRPCASTWAHNRISSVLLACAIQLAAGSEVLIVPSAEISTSFLWPGGTFIWDQPGRDRVKIPFVCVENPLTLFITCCRVWRNGTQEASSSLKRHFSPFQNWGETGVAACITGFHQRRCPVVNGWNFHFESTVID